MKYQNARMVSVATIYGSSRCTTAMLTVSNSMTHDDVTPHNATPLLSTGTEQVAA